MTKPRAFLLAIAAAFAVLGAATSSASAACSLTAAPSDSTIYTSSQTTTGTFSPSQKGQYVQIPFTVDPGTTGIRVRYCYENPTDSGTTLDMGVYEPLKDGDTQWGMKESRGWSGSAVRNIGIAVNGFTSESAYNASRKAFVPGKTTRAYQPGPIPAGTWATELGLAYLPDAGNIAWTVEVSTTNESAWSDTPFAPDPYVPYVANPNPGWYDGDFHVHGEGEPGNAPMSQTFAKGFGVSPTGNDLDFMTLVDHNNIVSRSTLGAYPASNPGKLIIPGTEETTYNGHFNSQNSNTFADFRTGPIYKFTDGDANNVVDTGELSQVRGSTDPSAAFSTIDGAGGFSQINHPTIFQTAPAACRGCFWNYSPTQTDYSKVDTIEVSTGTAVFPANQNPVVTSANPFLAGAIAFYEQALATGNHIAAVASSDDHQGGAAVGIQDSQVGRGATAVYADQLSQAAITAAVKADHTYAKPFGADAPDVTMTATAPGKPAAIVGDSITGPTATLAINVKNAGASAARPATYTLEILKDGVSVDSIVITSDNFDHSYTATSTGRYSFEVSRTPGTDKLVEAYSSPIWFTQVDDPIPSNAFKVTKTIYNKKKGTADLKVKVTSPGSISLKGKGVAKSSARVKAANATVTLKVKATGKTAKNLKKKGKAKVKVTITNSPTGGTARKLNRTITLKAKKAKKKK